LAFDATDTSGYADLLNPMPVQNVGLEEATPAGRMSEACRPFPGLFTVDVKPGRRYPVFIVLVRY
jgi:hypothetical protein